MACATGAAAAPAPLATTFAAELAASSTQLGAKLEEALQDTREALHADIRDLHVELLRQFQLCTVRRGRAARAARTAERALRWAGCARQWRARASPQERAAPSRSRGARALTCPARADAACSPGTL